MNNPHPFCFNPNKIKAFVLGCDPTNFSDNGDRVDLNFVFGIGQDERYFRDILKNLNLVGLHLEDIYVQNLVKDYQDKETAKYKNWEKTANENLPGLTNEFDELDKTHKIPVFLTAEKLYTFLLNDGKKRYQAEQIYNLGGVIPISPNENKLNRPLIPLYRYPKYNLSNWVEYAMKIKMNVQL